MGLECLVLTALLLLLLLLLQPVTGDFLDSPFGTMETDGP